MKHLLQKLFLDEITEKNQAIHAYDRMIWTVRTEFLTLLKSIVDNSSGTQVNLIRLLIVYGWTLSKGCRI